MSGLWNDARYAVRQMAKNPGFATVAILTLALGVAANTVIFTVMNATILKVLPFPNPDRLVVAWQTSAKNPNDYNIVSASNYRRPSRPRARQWGRRLLRPRVPELLPHDGPAGD